MNDIVNSIIVGAEKETKQCQGLCEAAVTVVQTVLKANLGCPRRNVARTNTREPLDRARLSHHHPRRARRKENIREQSKWSSRTAHPRRRSSATPTPGRTPRSSLRSPRSSLFPCNVSLHRKCCLGPICGYQLLTCRRPWWNAYRRTRVQHQCVGL